MNKIVTISIEGGVIQEVNCPVGVHVIIRDYDVDGTESNLAEDESGDEYIETIWE